MGKRTTSQERFSPLFGLCWQSQIGNSLPTLYCLSPTARDYHCLKIIHSYLVLVGAPPLISQILLLKVEPDRAFPPPPAIQTSFVKSLFFLASVFWERSEKRLPVLNHRFSFLPTPKLISLFPIPPFSFAYLFSFPSASTPPPALLEITERSSNLR